MQILAESTIAPVIAAVHLLHDATRGPRVAKPVNLVIAFERDRARRATGHATPAAALPGRGRRPSQPAAPVALTPASARAG